LLSDFIDDDRKNDFAHLLIWLRIRFGLAQSIEWKNHIHQRTRSSLFKAKGKVGHKIVNLGLSLLESAMAIGRTKDAQALVAQGIDVRGRLQTTIYHEVASDGYG
jgi:hypothetical protein